MENRREKVRKDKLRISCYGHLIFAGLDFERSSKKVKGVGEKVHCVTVDEEGSEREILDGSRRRWKLEKVRR